MATGGNESDFGEHGIKGGNKRDFGEHATKGGNKRDFGEHATKSGYKRDFGWKQPFHLPIPHAPPFPAFPSLLYKVYTYKYPLLVRAKREEKIVWYCI